MKNRGTHGWSEEAETPGNLGIPDESFDYEEYVKREFGGEASPEEKRGRFWKIVGLVVLICLGYWLFAAFL